MQHDMDARFDNQDRMINYLLKQIQDMESAANNRLGKANDMNERDRDMQNKRITDLKLQYDNALSQLGDLVIKFNNLN